MKSFLTLLLAVAVIFLLWPTPVLYPLKVLVVFFHESSHALMTVMTGGHVVELVIDKQQGGHVLSSGGNRFLTLSAGYLGSLVWGALIYWLSVATRYDKAIMFSLGLGIIAIAGFFIRDSFSLVFSGLVGISMLIVAIKAPMHVNDILLRIIGMTSMLYVPLDIYSDTIKRSELRSDAFMLAEQFGGTTILWGGIWLLLSLIIVALVLKVTLKRDV